MTLLEFAKRQEEYVAKLARDIRRLFVLKPTFDAEAYAKKACREVPLLKGVSSNEILAEAISPGSFRNGGDT